MFDILYADAMSQLHALWVHVSSGGGTAPKFIYDIDVVHLKKMDFIKLLRAVGVD